MSLSFEIPNLKGFSFLIILSISKFRFSGIFFSQRSDRPIFALSPPSVYKLHINLYLLTCSHSITRAEQNNNFPIYNFGSQTVTVELYTSFCLDLAWLVWAGSSGLTTAAQWTGTPLSATARAAQLRWDRRGANMWHTRLPWWQS